MELAYGVTRGRITVHRRLMLPAATVGPQVLLLLPAIGPLSY